MWKATRKGVHLPDRPNQVAMMAQMQNMIDFPPAPKLGPMGRLDPDLATEQELAGEEVFMGKGQCAVCHIPQTAFRDNNMHDLQLERFYEIGHTANGMVMLPMARSRRSRCAASRLPRLISITAV